MSRFIIRQADGFPVGFFSDRADAQTALKEYVKFGMIVEEK